ncbi:hypothetical protein [Terrimonas pollutisoli]|uniref:hypothetical protein n=1 Tax=Terrimonas pollutisoli TaxID=3034147 RepID=UPI0023EA849B|nr:hypothetical protein [Terrimonas sp. H1YJ31]
MKTFYTLLICLVVSGYANAIIAPFDSVTASFYIDGDTRIKNLNCQVKNEKLMISWSTEENEKTNRFELEKSKDGKQFLLAAIVFGTDKKDTDNYMFYEKASKKKIFYRVKIIQNDGSVGYSPIVTP